jgi:dihydrolipoamide dehydrogenase
VESYDLIVIGAGPGGYTAAERAAERGRNVLLAEQSHLGGVCTNSGCIPTKSLLNAAKHYTAAREGARFGVNAEKVSFDLAAAMAWKKDTVASLRRGIEYLMKKNGVKTVFGRAEFFDAHTVEVDGAHYRADRILIASGSSPASLPIPGADGPNVLTSSEILEITELPRRLAVIGGGVIGVEFASFFSQVGTEVTVIEMTDEIVPLLEPELAKMLRRELDQVDFRLGCRVNEITAEGVRYTDAGGNEQTAAADLVLTAVGRRPNISGLEKLRTSAGFGLAVSPKGISVDSHMRTNLPHVYAVGDVTGKSLLAHSAARMAEVAVDHMFPEAGMPDSRTAMRYHAVPWVLYSAPEAAGCGMTEAEARAAGYRTVHSAMQMRANGRFLAEHGKKARGICKVVADEQTGLILGVHYLGGSCSELIHSAAVCLEAELRVQDVREMIFPHPTVSEVFRDLCASLARSREFARDRERPDKDKKQHDVMSTAG